MIAAAPQTAFDTLVARLTGRAAALARARVEARTRERRDDPRRWRKAALVWPLFGR